MDSSTMDFQNRSLQQQGFREFTDKELTELRWGLRFTPAVCMALALYGLMTRNADIHFALTFLGMLPMFLPAGHPFDLIYNLLLRPIWKGVKLPPNPLPRRIACFSGGAMNLLVALAFTNHMPMLAYIAGGMLIVLQLIVITSHFCVASWMYEGLLRMLGMWEEPLDPEAIRELQAQGAMVVDVREPHEYAEGHLPKAFNLPLSQLPNRHLELEDKLVLLYCRSGMRSGRAKSILKSRGHSQCHDLGGMERARRILQGTAP